MAPRVKDVARFGMHGETLRLAGAGLATVTVFDMGGRLVARENFDGTGEVSLAPMVKATGLYRVVVRQGDAKFTATYAKVR